MQAQGLAIEHNGKCITILFPSGMFEYYSDTQERFLKFDDMEECKESIDNEQEFLFKN
jgi:hypothetical protein